MTRRLRDRTILRSTRLGCLATSTAWCGGELLVSRRPERACGDRCPCYCGIRLAAGVPLAERGCPRRYMASSLPLFYSLVTAPNDHHSGWQLVLLGVSLAGCGRHFGRQRHNSALSAMWRAHGKAGTVCCVLVGAAHRLYGSAPKQVGERDIVMARQLSARLSQLRLVLSRLSLQVAACCLF